MNSSELEYLKFKEKFIDAISSEEFYENFINSLKSGKNSLTSYQKYTNKVIDKKWVEAIEEAIVPLDNIIRNPRRFIAQYEEIVPIEQARKITEESIRHLAQHTNMIAKVEDDGMVTPNKILNIFKEETYATYENRFIYTLLINLQYFIDKRLTYINKAKTHSEFKVSFGSEFTLGDEQLTYDLKVSSIEDISHVDHEYKVKEDTSKLTITQRIDRIRKILYDFQSSALIKSLKGVAIVKPPIMRTNVLLKNPDFKKCLELWHFIEMYADAGVAVELIENEVKPSEEYTEDLINASFVNYIIFNHFNKPDRKELAKVAKPQKFTPELIEHFVTGFVNDYSIDVSQVEKIFVNYIRKSSKQRKEEEAKMKKIIKDALKRERMAKKKALEKAKKDKQAELLKKRRLQKAKEDAEIRRKERLAKKKAYLAELKKLQEERKLHAKDRKRLKEIREQELKIKALLREVDEAEAKKAKAKAKKAKKTEIAKLDNKIKRAKAKAKALTKKQRDEELEKARKKALKEKLAKKKAKELALAKEAEKKKKAKLKAKKAKAKLEAEAKAKKQKEMAKKKAETARMNKLIEERKARQKKEREERNKD